MENKTLHTKEEVYEIAFELIIHAGDAKSAAENAIKAANTYDFEKAEALMKEAVKELQEAHHVQTDVAQAEARGDQYEVSVLLVHAQDHLAMAITAISTAKQMLNLNRRIFALEEKMERIMEK